MADGSSGRVERVAELIKRELADIFQRKIKDPRLQESVVSQARLSSDLRVAWISLSHYDADEETIRAALEKAKGFIRRELSARLSLRHSPELRFEMDRGPQQLMEMTQRLRKLRIEDGREDSQDESDEESRLNP